MTGRHTVRTQQVTTLTLHRNPVDIVSLYANISCSYANWLFNAYNWEALGILRFFHSNN